MVSLMFTLGKLDVSMGFPLCLPWETRGFHVVSPGFHVGNPGFLHVSFTYCDTGHPFKMVIMRTRDTCT